MSKDDGQTQNTASESVPIDVQGINSTHTAIRLLQVLPWVANQGDFQF